jgi:hypothetical protein
MSSLLSNRPTPGKGNFSTLQNVLCLPTVNISPHVRSPPSSSDVAYRAEFGDTWKNSTQNARRSSPLENQVPKRNQLSNAGPSEESVLDAAPSTSSSSTPSTNEAVSAGVVGNKSVLDVTTTSPSQQFGKETIASETTLLNPSSQPLFDQHGRPIVYTDDFDFATMHNLLYFLYTGYANLHYRPTTHDEHFEGLPLGYPPPVDPFTLYQAADMYLVEALKERCYRYLTLTCTTQNICQRLLENSACNHYEGLSKFYFEFIVKNYDAVKKGKEWERIFLSMKESPPELFDYQVRKLLEITKTAPVAKS